jgi:alkanesulfonate monooxygenase SsuD/methylene tetrahydromethanopterin reductase-like flavin-dependent oxidoreductase (luciferase family)
MTQPLSIGFTLPQRGIFFGATSWPELAELSAQVDADDRFDSLWVGDSILAKPRPESLTMLGALSAITKRVKLGVGCMASFPIRDPILFAYQWANLDLLSNGRMLLAACTGIVPNLSAAEGSNWQTADRQRGARLVENIDICRRLWSSDHVSFTGKFRSFADVTISPRPIQQPCPIWIASNPPPVNIKALARVAKHADGWMTVAIFPKMFDTNWKQLCVYLEAVHRSPQTFPNRAYHNINLNSDRNAALEESKRFLDEYYGPIFTPQMVESWTAAGTPAQCVEHLRALVAEGAKAFTLRITGWNQKAQFERLVNEVLPPLTQVSA